MTNLEILSIPYFFASLIIIFGFDTISIWKWTWSPPPSYIRVPVGLLWPIWVSAILIYTLLGKMTYEIDKEKKE